jgi:methionine sulfoxide reductase heme-binding subunit
MRSAQAARVILKPAVFGLSLWPSVTFAWDMWLGQLGLHPYRRLIVDSGDWALWFLVFTLMLTPARRLTGWHWLNLFRRMLGLFAFFYASVHALAYVTFESFAAVQLEGVGGAWATVGSVIARIGHESADKPFIALGVIAVAALAPLAVTSSAVMIRRLGGKRWRRLHRLVFVAAGAGLFHHWWPLGDRFQIDAFGLSLVLLVVVRLAWWRHSATARPPSPVQSAEPESTPAQNR